MSPSFTARPTHGRRTAPVADLRVPDGLPAPASGIRFVPALPIPGGTPCAHCGEPRWLDILDYDDRARWLQPIACCEAQTEAVVAEMAEWPRAVWAAFLADRLGLRARRVLTTDTATGAWELDFGLTLRPARWQEAKAAVAAWHAHLPVAPPGWRWGHAVENGAELMGVAIVGRPSARSIDPAQCVEVTRCYVRRDLSPGFVWNACSMLYAAAVREAARRGFATVITYTRADSEHGASLRAAGFVAVHRSVAQRWSRPSRPRAETAPPCAKVRWERATVPARGSARAGAEGHTLTGCSND